MIPVMRHLSCRVQLRVDKVCLCRPRPDRPEHNFQKLSSKELLLMICRVPALA